MCSAACLAYRVRHAAPLLCGRPPAPPGIQVCTSTSFRLSGPTAACPYAALQFEADREARIAKRKGFFG